MTKEVAILESKILEGELSQSTNIHRISNDVFTFTEYNFLPSCTEDVLDGHFTIFVNYKTFEYLLYKSSDYGSFTYVMPCEFGGFFTPESLPKSSKERIESHIAHKLLRAYFYDGNHINHKGTNLIPNEDGEWGGKCCLICDERGYIWSEMKPEQYSDVELKALKVLISFEPPTIKEFDPEFVKEFVSKFKGKKGVQRQRKLNIEGTEYVVVHEVSTIYGCHSALLNNKGTVLSTYILNHTLSNFIKCIPTLLKNIAQ